MKRVRKIAKPILFLLICTLVSNLFFVTSKAAPKTTVIVIDPGRGGESTGADYFGTQEKDITLTVSLAIKDYLDRFDNVEVYLTRTDDSELTFTRRIQIANGKGADVFISILFNESENHNRTGFEVWVPTDQKLQKKVMPLAESLSQNADMHVNPSLGVFTCVNNDGEDYYGQLRRAAQGNMPAVIIRELYMDRAENKAIIHSDEELKEIGKQNAIAIAKAYHLKSESLGIDYSKLANSKYSAPTVLTEEVFVYPKDIELSLVDFEQTSDTVCTANFKVQLSDSEDKITAYRYSLDRGKTYSGLTPVSGGSSFEFTLTAKPGDEQILRVMAFNEQGLSVTSNELELNRIIKLDPEFTEKKTEEAIEAYKFRDPVKIDIPVVDDKGVFADEVRFSPTKSIVIVFGAAAGLAICLILLIGQIKPKKKGGESHAS